MPASISPPAALPSLVAVTFRRGLLTGRFYLAIGVLVSLVLTLALLRSARGPGVFVETFPLEIPLFGSLGAMGGLMLFTADRSKGVLEYLIAYGVRPWTLFANCLLVTVGLSSIVLGIALAVGLGDYAALGNSLNNSDLVDGILGYTVPMTYASALFACLCGMVWSTLSTPRMGLNSPLGIAPMLGIAPPIVVLFVAEAAPSADYYDVSVGASLIFVAVVVVLLIASARLMNRERFLSPM